MDDEVPHLRVVDRLLGLGLPRRVGARIIRVDADNIQVREIFERDRIKPFQLATEDEMEQLSGLARLRHHAIPMHSADAVWRTRSVNANKLAQGCVAFAPGGNERPSTGLPWLWAGG